MGQISSQDAADFLGNPPEPDTPEPMLEELKVTTGHEFFTAGNTPGPDWQPQAPAAAPQGHINPGQVLCGSLPEPTREQARHTAEFHARHTFSQIDPTIFHG